ncbi:MAG TPA: thioredoxin family protein [Paludibacter sp.]|nr:thioredoxin family protein [Paludibacter sp.]
MKKTLQLLLLCIIVSSTAMAQKSTNVEIVDLTTQSFKQKVWNFDKDKTFKRVGELPIILDFHATWCRPCKMLAPHLQAIQNKYKGKLVIYRIDVDQEPELAQRFKVQAMPTVVFIGSKTKFNSELGYREYDEVEKLVKTYFFGAK